MLRITELFGDDHTAKEKFKRNISFGIHVCLPCVIQSYDPEKNTVECQPTIRERIVNEDGSISYIEYPILINVPVVQYSCGSFYISMPIAAGDECLVVFSDLSIDNWWLKGNIQNPVEQRRHDLSDGFAIVGLRNQTKQIKPMTNLEIGSFNGDKITYGTNGLASITSGGQTATFSNIISVVNAYGTHIHDAPMGQTGPPKQG